MKKLTFIVASFILLFTACSDSNDSQDADTDKIIEHHFSGFIGQEFHFVIDPKPNYCTLECDNPEIATVGFNYNSYSSIYIKTHKEGTATVKVLNDKGKVIAMLTASVSYFGSAGLEEGINHPTFRYEVLVEADDADVKKQIEDELWTYLSTMQRSLYTFANETKTFTMKITETGEEYEGTYDWSINHLTLKYNGITETYGFEIDKLGRHYILLMDKTYEYQLLYPDAGITFVKYNRIWFDHYKLLLGGLEIR